MTIWDAAFKFICLLRKGFCFKIRHDFIYYVQSFSSGIVEIIPYLVSVFFFQQISANNDDRLCYILFCGWSSRAH